MYFILCTIREKWLVQMIQGTCITSRDKILHKYLHCPSIFLVLYCLQKRSVCLRLWGKRNNRYVQYILGFSRAKNVRPK